MYRLDDQQLVLSATDLTSYLACEHLIEQRRAVALGERSRWARLEDPHGQLAKDRGVAHEQDQLERLSAQLGGHVDLEPPKDHPFTREWHVAQAARTTEAMRDGAPLIYQAQLFDGRWQGRADFLRRIEVPSDLGALDATRCSTPSSRGDVKPHVVHQLALYNAAARRGPGPRCRQAAHLVLGDGCERAGRPRRYAALHRHVARRLERLVDAPAVADLPRARRALRDLRPRARVPTRAGVADDHLSLVAGRAPRPARAPRRGRPRHGPRARGGARRHSTRARSAPQRFDLLHHQAALQVALARRRASRRTATCRPSAAAGYALPARRPTPGRRLLRPRGRPVRRRRRHRVPVGLVDRRARLRLRLGARPRCREGRVRARSSTASSHAARAHPGLHVFHYAAARAVEAALARAEVRARARTRSTTCCATSVLVDLYAVVRQGLQVGEESYSLKRLERHHGFARRETTRARGRRLDRRLRDVARDGRRRAARGDPRLQRGGLPLDARRCATGCSDRMRPEAARQFGVRLRRRSRRRAAEESCPAAAMAAAMRGARRAPRRRARRRRHAGRRRRRPSGACSPTCCSTTAARASPSGGGTSSCAACRSTSSIDERDALGGLVRSTDRPSPCRTSARCDYTFSFPPQEFKLDPGRVRRSRRPGKQRQRRALEDDRVVIRRETERQRRPAPRALIAAQRDRRRRAARGASSRAARRRCSTAADASPAARAHPAPRAAAAASGGSLGDVDAGGSSRRRSDLDASSLLACRARRAPARRSAARG